MTPERWLRAAISDDTVVADLLLRLKHSPSLFSKPLPPPSWGLRQPRSSSSSAPPSSYKVADTHRRSPTTPLSWTGGSSGDSSSLNFFHPPPPPPSHRLTLRSKGSAASDTPTTSSKRTRRKKSFAELKDEESSLLKERTFLEKELATLRVTLIEQRSINQNLKRIKLDLHVESKIILEANSNPTEENMFPNGTCGATSSSASGQIKNEVVSEHSSPSQKGGPSQEHVFVLPDLNIAPDEDCNGAAIS